MEQRGELVGESRGTFACLSPSCPEQGAEWEDELPPLGRRNSWPSCQLCDETAWLLAVTGSPG